MMADGVIVGDGTWLLRVFVTDLAIDRTLRVRGDLHIGGVMLRLVEDLGKFTVQVPVHTGTPTVYSTMISSVLKLTSLC